MSRLVVRLLLALLAVSLVSMIIVPIAQTIAARQTLNALPPEFRQRVQKRTQPPPLGRRIRLPRNGFPEDRTSDIQPDIQEDASRLFTLLSDYRAAQRRSILGGLAAALVLGVALALWLARSIATPIEAVSKAAQRLSQGDLSTRVPLKTLEHQPLETRALATDFNRMADALETLSGERKAMIADIAHELRNPLATLQFRLDALEDGLATFSQEELRLLRGQVGLLSRLIEDLRMLSLADAGKLSLQKTKVALSQLVRSVTESYQNKARRQRVRLEARLSKDEIYLTADPDRLAQILHNLLDNAFKVTPEDGWIEVELTSKENEVVLTVRDSGPGIPEGELETIFERFVQGKRRDMSGGQSSGLGLAIVHTLVNLHGGQIRASNHGAGAQLELTLPRSI